MIFYLSPVLADTICVQNFNKNFFNDILYNILFSCDVF